MTSEELQRMTTEQLRIDEYPFSIRPLAPDDGGGYLIEYPDLQYCMSDGETPEEAIVNGKDALRGVLLTMMEFGDPIPEPGSFRLLPIAAELGAQLDAQAIRRGAAAEEAAEIISKGLSEWAV